MCRHRHWFVANRRPDDGQQRPLVPMFMLRSDHQSPHAKLSGKPAALRSFASGSEVWKSRLGTTTHTLVAMDATSMRYKVAESDCTYTLPRDGLLPWTVWTNCRPLPDGSQTVTLTAGQIWPLEIGRTWRYRRAGSDSSGDRWDEEVHCEVTKQGPGAERGRLLPCFLHGLHVRDRKTRPLCLARSRAKHPHLVLPSRRVRIAGQAGIGGLHAGEVESRRSSFLPSCPCPRPVLTLSPLAADRREHVVAATRIQVLVGKSARQSEGSNHGRRGAALR